MKTPSNKPDTTKTGEAWRDEFCEQCKGIRQHDRDEKAVWRCIYCGHAPDNEVQRRLQRAWENKLRPE